MSTNAVIANPEAPAKKVGRPARQKTAGKSVQRRAPSKATTVISAMEIAAILQAAKAELTRVISQEPIAVRVAPTRTLPMVTSVVQQNARRAAKKAADAAKKAIADAAAAAAAPEATGVAAAAPVTAPVIAH